MKKLVSFLCAAVFSSALLLTSCDTNGTASSTAAVSGQSRPAPVVTTGGEEDAATTGEQDAATTAAPGPAGNETTPAKTDTQTTVSLPKPPARIALADLDYWSRADALRICHTQSPPYKAVTLKKGSKEYEKILSLLRRAEGGYWGTSQGLAGGFMPVYVYQGTTQLDRISISTGSNRNAQFQTDTQQESSRVESVVRPYTSIYTMSESLCKEINEFFESLEYTEDLHPGQSASTRTQCVPDASASEK